MEVKSKLAKAIIAVMSEVKGIEKSMTVGTGQSQYKGVPDQEVKKIIGDAMAKNGLCILPIGIEAKTTVARWDEVDTYSNANPKPMKSKQSVFTEATTKYLLLHESGESMEISGYGHGVDSQDKGAGKATTYALKYTLLYLFLVPTGKIDDSDATHSNEIEAPKQQQIKPAQINPEGKVGINDVQLTKVVDRIKSGELDAYTNAINVFLFTEDQRKSLDSEYALAKAAKEAKKELEATSTTNEKPKHNF